MTQTTTPHASAAVLRLMEEARRRFESFQVRYGKALRDGWVGLGFPSEYKPAVEAGLMRVLGGNERPRILQWYLLTDAGLDLYRSLFPGSEEGSVRVYRDGSLVESYDATLKDAA